MMVHKVSLADLFSNRKRYVVPLFQRAYVWSKDRQWQPLWQDVQDRAEAVLRAAPNTRPQDHFMGAIVTAPRAAFGVGVPVAELIDGQQRLTSECTTRASSRSTSPTSSPAGEFAQSMFFRAGFRRFMASLLIAALGSIGGCQDAPSGQQPQYVRYISVRYRNSRVNVADPRFVSTAGFGQIGDAWYDEAAGYLLITIKGTVYHYCRVPPSVWSTVHGMGIQTYESSLRGKHDCREGGIPEYQDGM